MSLSLITLSSIENAFAFVSLSRVKYFYDTDKRRKRIHKDFFKINVSSERTRDTPFPNIIPSIFFLFCKKNILVEKKKHLSAMHSLTTLAIAGMAIEIYLTVHFM